LQIPLSLDNSESNDDLINPITNFLFALQAPETKRQYPRRLEVFFRFFKHEGDLRQQTKKTQGKNQK